MVIETLLPLMVVEPDCPGIVKDSKAVAELRGVPAAVFAAP